MKRQEYIQRNKPRHINTRSKEEWTPASAPRTNAWRREEPETINISAEEYPPLPASPKTQRQMEAAAKTEMTFLH